MRGVIHPPPTCCRALDEPNACRSDLLVEPATLKQPQQQQSSTQHSPCAYIYTSIRNTRRSSYVLLRSSSIQVCVYLVSFGIYMQCNALPGAYYDPTTNDYLRPLLKVPAATRRIISTPHRHCPFGHLEVNPEWRPAGSVPKVWYHKTKILFFWADASCFRHARRLA